MTWQKKARMFVLLIAVGVAVAVFATTRRREEPPPQAPVTRADPKAVMESSGAVIVQVKGERETVTIRAEKQFSYEDGSSRLVGVHVKSVRQGKTFVATGTEAKIGKDQTQLEMKGNVRMTSSDGLEVSAESATYSQVEGVVRAPGPVTFKRGRMSGSGVDFSYDEKQDLIGLSDRTNVKIAPSKTAKSGGEATDITAGAAVLARQDKFVSFERAVHIVHGDQVIDADSALGDLTEDEEHLSGLDLQGAARIETPAAKPGELKRMAGDLINLTYFENSDLVQSAVITGGASLRIAGERGAPERILHAQNVEVGMAPDGTTVTSLSARDQVVLELPGTKEQPSKSVRANALVASGEAGKGLTAAMFSEGVEYGETGGTPPVKRTVTSRTLETVLNGGLGDIREATFLGTPARLRDESGGAGANADTIRYNIQTGQVELTGTPGGVLPHVVNDQLAVDAERVEMSIEGSKMKAAGPTTPVRTVMLPVKKGATSARRTPGIMQKDQPVNATSRELVYAGGDASIAEFSGSVRMWQGEKADMVIQADKVSVDSGTGNLTAQGSVLSMMMVQDTNPTTKARETTRSTGHGQQMLYDDAKRTLTYTTKARLIGAQGILTAETIVVTLGANGQDVERLEATANVEMSEKEPDRVTTGDHLSYVAATGEYTVTGKGRLARMTLTTADGCRRSDGHVLTFSRLTDSLRIDGGEQTRTSTASEKACTPTPAAPKN